MIYQNYISTINISKMNVNDDLDEFNSCIRICIIAIHSYGVIDKLVQLQLNYSFWSLIKG